MEEDVFRLTLIGYNEQGLIGFINGTNELLYLERPHNWEDYVKKFGLPYIKHEDVHAVNLKNYREEGKDAKQSKRRKNKTTTKSTKT
jgi:hypothetical protein